MRHLVVAAFAALSLSACGKNTNCKDACDKLSSCSLSSSKLSCTSSCTDPDAKCAGCINDNACDKIASTCASECPAGTF